jgi:thiamine-phosphate pyrophosphorylase
VNDSVEIALGCGADGVHLGGQDGSWRDARRLLGPDRIVGGSMNRPDDARRAVAAGCLDYVGVGPLRFTATKTDLSPLLGFEGTREIIALLRGVPAWVIGGVEASDAGQLRRTGAAGVAVSSSLYRGGRIEENLRDFLEAWAASPSPREVTS